MAERVKDDLREARLLDAWQPPEDAGEAVGCLAISFKFDSAFFEEECIARFLRLEGDPVEDGPVYLLEREEKLAQLRFAAAIVDQNHCRGKRSLRWDLIPARVTGGVMHAKICLLHWARCLRLIIGSANLTPSGYRLNQEVFGVIDFHTGETAPVDVLDEVVQFLRHLVEMYAEMAPSVAYRFDRFLVGVMETVAAWAIAPDSAIRVASLPVAPGYPGAMEQLAALWPGGSPPDMARVISPFFDRDRSTPDAPAQALWGLLRQRGAARVEFHVTAEPANDGTGALLVHAPRTLLQAQPPTRPDLSTGFYRIVSEQARPLHAKAIWLSGKRWLLYMIGSSNFTSHGLGLGNANAPRTSSRRGNINVEANLVYIVDGNRQPELINQMQLAFLAGQPIEDDVPKQWQPLREEGEDAPGEDTLPLPAGFVSAIFGIDMEVGAFIDLTLAAPPAGWSLLHEDDARVYCSERDWQSAGCQHQYRLQWTEPRPPSGFQVKWDNAEGSAWWPVNVDSQLSLPPPEELKDLPLDVLISILTSARPLHQNTALKRHLKRKFGHESDTRGDTCDVLDPHKRVDTNRFLLQRTRRVGWALTALREKLERPVYSEERLAWRLRGPVGVMELAVALVRDAASVDEQAFLIAELVLELHRVVPQSTRESMPSTTVKQSIEALALELSELVPGELHADNGLGRYVATVFKMVDR